MASNSIADNQPRYRIDSSITMKRDVESGTYQFLDLFAGFEKLEEVKKVFGRETESILHRLNIEVFPREGFMGVSDEDGHIFASQSYLNTGESWSIYLDVVHELVHVRQFMEGKELFDQTYSYGDRPTEIEAYQVAAREARRIGLSEEEIFEYLKVPWIDNKEHERLALACEVPAALIQKNRRRNRKTAS